MDWVGAAKKGAEELDKDIDNSLKKVSTRGYRRLGRQGWRIRECGALSVARVG